MSVSVVIYDSAFVLPLTFVSDEGLGDSVVLIRDLAAAHRRGRQAEALVIVTGDQIGAIGLLTAFAEPHACAVLLFLMDAEQERRVMIHGARRGAAVMIGEPPKNLAACLRDVVARPPFSCRPTVYRAVGAPMSAAEVCLLRVAGRRAGQHGRRAS